MRRAETTVTDHLLQTVEREPPKPGPGEVVVEIAASYVAPFLNDLIPPDTAFVTPERPFVPGSDAIGRLVEIGPGGANLSVGDMVFVDCLVDDRWDGHDGHAAFAGNFAVSNDATGLLADWRDGTFATHIRVPASNVTSVAPALPHAPAASLCRLGWFGTALSALRNGGFAPGMTVAVIGASGQVGSSAIMLAHALGATQVTAVGRDVARMAPLLAIDPSIQLANEVPVGCDLVISTSDGDCGAMVEDALSRLARRGTLVLVASPNSPLSVSGIVLREVTLRGSFWFPPDMPGELVAMIADGTLDLSVLTAHTFPLDEVNAALDAARDMPPLHHVALIP
ncbi:MAG: alcohol dehydrogenase catalytic domain-containing protein [Pseudomonadota bacterium]